MEFLTTDLIFSGNTFLQLNNRTVVKQYNLMNEQYSIPQAQSLVFIPVKKNHNNNNNYMALH